MKKVLVLCSANSCRSQMAEGYLRYYAGSTAEVHSAGLDEFEVNPLAVKVMAEDSIDISGNTSKSFRKFRGTKFDYLITVCDEASNSIPNSIRARHKIHFSIPDPDIFEGPETEKLRFFRKTRELVKKSMLKFIGQELTGSEAALYSD